MSEPKPLASLSGSLLARKGAARPAMRPQLQRLRPEQANTAVHLEDLGWDDMGEPESAQRLAEILPLTPAPLHPEAAAESRADDIAAAAQLAENAIRLASKRDEDDARPEVVRQQEAIVEMLAADAHVTAAPRPIGNEETEPAKARPSANPAPRQKRARRSALQKGGRAAFTLRLDASRHLKLRLASAVRHRSAQQLVTEALDRLLESMPEIDTLTAQLQPQGPETGN